MYQCKERGTYFRGGLRMDNTALWNEYVSGCRILVELVSVNNLAERTVRRRFSRRGTGRETTP